MKKGELSIQVIVVAALALIVLITLILIFRGQITKTSGAYSNISEGSAEAAREAQSKLWDLFGGCTEGASRRTDTQTFCCIDGNWEPHSLPCPEAE